MYFLKQPPYGTDEMDSLRLRRACLEFDLMVSLNHHHTGSLLGICQYINGKCLHQPSFQRLTSIIRGIQINFKTDFSIKQFHIFNLCII